MKYLKFLLCVFVTLFCTLPIFSQIPSYIPTNGLVGWWPFNGNANDESGNGNNGTVSGAVLTVDRNGYSNRAYFFNHTDVINTNYNGISGTQPRTFSFWMKNQSSTKMISPIWYGGHPTNPSVGSGFNIIFNRNEQHDQCNCWPTTYHGIGVTGDWVMSIRQTVVGDNQWHNWVVTLETAGNTFNQVKYYKDGIVITSAIIFDYNNNGSTVVNTINQNKLKFGVSAGLSNNPDRAPTEYLDDIAVWNRALSSQEIANLYAGSLCGVTLNPVISGSSFAYVDSVYTYSVQQQNGRTYQWSTKNGGSIVGSSTNSIVQVEWDTVARDTLLVRETDTQSGCYKDTMLIVSSKFPVYYKATWVNTAPRILPNPTNGMSCYPGTPNCVGGMIDSTTNPGSRSVTFGTFNARPDTIIGINPILPTIRFQIVYRDNGSVIHDTGPLGSDRLTYDSRIGLVTCKLGPFTYDYGRELAMKVISPSGTQTTDIVSLVKANGELYIIPE
jgi:hypothetical protein